MFVKHIIMSKGSPMCIKHNSYKVEFALRGAGHIHGVLWIDWENLIAQDPENRLVRDAFVKIRNEETIGEDDKNIIAAFADRSITCSLKNAKTKHIVEEVQMHHHTKACRKYCTKCRFTILDFLLEEQ